MIIALAQINPVVGDFAGNYQLMMEQACAARRLGAGLVVFPELALSGYPPRDLLEKRSFVDRNRETFDRFVHEIEGVAVVTGLITRNESGQGKPLRNSVALAAGGEVLHWSHKCLLPTYDVFDEARYFQPAASCEGLAEYGGMRLGLTICEDMWNDGQLFPQRLYAYDPVQDLAARRPDILINISASPFCLGKPAQRERIVRHAAARYGVPVLMVNQVGGFDDIIFDGQSLAAAAGGAITVRGPAFESGLPLFSPEAGGGNAPGPEAGEPELIYRALVLGTRDYTRKCGFAQVVIGLSGGIDSALVACIAVEALGPENVTGVAMPSPFSSPGSVADARALAANLGIRLEIVPIGPVYESFLSSLAPLFAGRPFGTAEENLQARVRGTILMGLSNKFGAMVLSTGNKSELAVGYSTLYGDMCGGLAVISDLLKTKVYEVARWINREREIIPVATLEKPPSAELRPGQRDQDDLPPYEVLDAILGLYVEKLHSGQEIIQRGFDRELVHRIVRMVDRNEYKRRQAPPGLKITAKAFGTGRRLPIVQRFAD